MKDPKIFLSLNHQFSIVLKVFLYCPYYTSQKSNVHCDKLLIFKDIISIRNKDLFNIYTNTNNVIQLQ